MIDLPDKRLINNFSLDTNQLPRVAYPQTWQLAMNSDYSQKGSQITELVNQVQILRGSLLATQNALIELQKQVKG